MMVQIEPAAAAVSCTHESNRPHEYLILYSPLTTCFPTVSMIVQQNRQHCQNHHWNNHDQGFDNLHQGCQLHLEIFFKRWSVCCSSRLLQFPILLSPMLVSNLEHVLYCCLTVYGCVSRFQCSSGRPQLRLPSNLNMVTNVLYECSDSTLS